MLREQGSAIEIQRRYYTDTAQRYEHMHALEGAADPACIARIAPFFAGAGISSILEVGTANGCGLRNLRTTFPNAFVCGLEPVPALLAQAGPLGHRAGVSLIRGSGEQLPFADESFDAVCEFSVLHHVPDPGLVVQEMLRVARKVVLIADSNRFGQGRIPVRWLKLALYKVGLWKAFNFMRTRGKGYMITEGDGLAYSYSVYDSYPLVRAWTDDIIQMPSSPSNSASWFHPLLTSGGVYLFAFRRNADQQANSHR